MKIFFCDNRLGGLLGFPIPHFIHFPLLCNTEGQRLSKRDKSLDMGSLREHLTARQIIGRLAYLAGLTPAPDPVGAKDLLPLFSWEKVPREDVVVAIM